jgi:hypothetical protein
VLRFVKDGARGLVNGAGPPADGGLLTFGICLLTRSWRPLPLLESFRGWSLSASASSSCLRFMAVDTDDMDGGS